MAKNFLIIVSTPSSPEFVVARGAKALRTFSLFRVSFNRNS